jgi:hypothetical protein
MHEWRDLATLGECVKETPQIVPMMGIPNRRNSIQHYGQDDRKLRTALLN